MAQPPESSTSLDREPNDLLTNPQDGAALSEPSSTPDAAASAGVLEAESGPGEASDVNPSSATEDGKTDDIAPAETDSGTEAAASEPVSDDRAEATSTEVSADAGDAPAAEANHDNHMSGPVLDEPESFDDFNLDPKLRSAITAMGWVTPSPVQCKAFRPLVSGGDLMVQSHTGSGKTGAFCLPWLAARFDPAPASETGVQLLVVLPTRELAKQVCVELGRLASHLQIELLPVYGGTAMQPQLTALKNGVHAVVGTPGRILDHIRRRTLRLDRVRTVILDECDEMLSMGFLEDIRAILDACTAEHQTCLFSATLPSDVQRIARRYMRKPEMITLSGDSVAAAEIDHAYYMISGMLRTRDLVNILTTEDPTRAIIFCNTREETRLVANVLTREGYSAEPLSSDLTQVAREKVMKAMREHKIRFLVATDVAARGIDISHVTHVINYSFPEQAEGYVHRTGRTGRAGRTGTAISLIGPRDIGNFYYLKLQYSSIKPEERHLPPPEELQAARTQLKLDEISRLFPEQVSPEWVVLARGLMSDPRGEQVIGYLLEQAMKSTRRPRSLLDEEDDQDPSAEGHEARGAEQDQERSADTEPSRREGERGDERGDERDRSARRGRGGRERGGRERGGRERGGRERGARERGGRERDEQRGRDRKDRRDADQTERPTPKSNEEEAQPDLAIQAKAQPITEAPPTQAAPQVDAPETDAPQADAAPKVDAEATDAAPTAEAIPEARQAEADDAPEADSAEAATESPRPPRKTRRERRPRRSRNADESSAAAPTESGENTAPATADASDVTTPEATAAEGTPEAKSGEELGEDGQPRRRRRRRRRGRRRNGEEASTAEAPKSEDDAQVGSADAKAPVAETQSEEPEAASAKDESAPSEEGNSGRRRRRRRRRGGGSGGDSPKSESRQSKPKSPPRVSQDEIIIEFDESELDVVRDHFGEVDELDDLTLKGRRRAVMDTLHDEVEIVDLSQVDASRKKDTSRDDEVDEDDNDDNGNDESGNNAETNASDDAKSSDGGEGISTASEEDGTTEGEAPKKKRRRRRRRKAQPIEMPELTAPPHKDFWEVWSARFTFSDFEDDKYLDQSELEAQVRQAEAEAAAEAEAKAARAAPKRKPRPATGGQEVPDSSFVKIRLNLGRSHGQKASTIRSLLREHLALEGRSIRDLTVRDASTLFRAPDSNYERIASTLNGIEINDVTIAVSRPDGAKTELRAPPPPGLEESAEDDSAAQAENVPAQAHETAPADAPTEDAPAAESAPAEAPATEAPVPPAPASEAAPPPEAVAAQVAPEGTSHSAQHDDPPAAALTAIDDAPPS